MAQLSVNEIEIQYLDQWFANLVDTINYDLQQIMVATVLPLTNLLTTVDTAPISTFRETLNNLVRDINNGFDEINAKITEMDSRIRALGA